MMRRSDRPQWEDGTGPAFTYTDAPSAHVGRRRAIAAKYPEVQRLMGRNGASAAWIAALVAIQLVAGHAASRLEWWLIPVAAYIFGAFVNHALYVLIHECTHNLVFRTSSANRLAGMACDIVLVVPSSMTFRKYHLLHHKYLGQHGLDPDIVGHGEARLVGNAPLRKALWLMLFSLSQALRPMLVRGTRMWDRWIVANLLAQLAFDVLIVVALGPAALAYLALSTFFALGLHPLGGRWIQEHYVTEKGQETYSYYGVLNRLCFNMGFHNEHHDFANIPWNNLPKLRKLAPEFYDSLRSYRSWVGVVLNFIFNRNMSTYSRIVRPTAP